MEFFHPKTFQFFGYEGFDCEKAPDDEWMPLSERVVDALLGPSLRTAVILNIPISCLKLTVFEMNWGTTAKVGRLVGRQKPFEAAQTSFMGDWEGLADDTLCRPHNYAMTALGISPLCEQRRREHLYSFRSGDVPCQCDRYCVHFGDCCGDLPRYIQDEFEAEHPHRRLRCLSTEFPEILYKGLGFYVIVSCSDAFGDPSVISKCRVPETDRERGFLFHIPVLKKGLVYRNVFCAMCNHEEVGPEDFWHTNFRYGIDPKCKSAFERMKANVSDGAFMFNDLCFTSGLSHPHSEFLEGESRMGKMCLYDPDMVDPYYATDVPTHLLAYYQNVEAVRPQCFCDSCHPSIRSYLTADMRPIVRLFFDNLTSPRFLSDFSDIIAYSINLPTTTGHIWDLFRATVGDDGRSSSVGDRIVSPFWSAVLIMYVIWG